MGKKLIGTSFSCCIIDMLRQDISEKDVAVLFTGTLFKSPADAFEAYAELFERANVSLSKAAVLIYRIWPKVVQPRTYGEFSTYIGDRQRIWFHSYEEFEDYYKFFNGKKCKLLYGLLYARIKSRVA